MLVIDRDAPRLDTLSMNSAYGISTGRGALVPVLARYIARIVARRAKHMAGKKRVIHWRMRRANVIPLVSSPLTCRGPLSALRSRASTLWRRPPFDDGLRSLLRMRSGGGARETRAARLMATVLGVGARRAAVGAAATASSRRRTLGLARDHLIATR